MPEMQKKWIPMQSDASARVRERSRSSLRKTIGILWKRKRILLIVFLLLCFAANGFYYAESLHTARTTVSLDYEEAAKGLTPSQTRFNIFEIRSAAVMERLIAYAGLQEQISPEELSECVHIRATHDKSVNGSDNFISTSYVIEFTNHKKIRRRSAETMLSLLCKSYREYFVEHYGVNHSILSFDLNDLKFNEEYLMTADLLELKCRQLEKYVQLCSRENKNYQDPETGLTFSALEQRVNNFYTFDLARLRSYIIENGIANDKPNLTATLDYKIRMDRLVCEKLMAAYEEDSRGIRLYDAAMSAVVMIPTEDVSMKYYMSRTKTGMDNMALHADAQLLGATEKTADIEYNTYLIEKLQSHVPTTEQKNKADTMILQMEASLEAIASDIRTVDNAFANYKARNYLSFTSDSSRFLDRIRPTDSILLSLVAFAAVFAVVFLRNLFDRENKAV